MTRLISDLNVLYHLLLRPVRGNDHAARLESFYAGQAERYDAFRSRLLHGRRELYEMLPVRDGTVWVDMGGGTGANLEDLRAWIGRARSVYVVDLAPSLLEVARRRIDRNGWTNVTAVQADAASFVPPAGAADVVTFSYALTMIPDWFAAIENARAMLKPGGLIGVVDYFVSRKHPPRDRARHSWITRSFWPLWFGSDNVFLSPDHVPFLQRQFEPLVIQDDFAGIPYLPLLRVPYYTFVGRKPR